MKSNTISVVIAIGALSAFAAGSAFAGEGPTLFDDHFVSSKTRAEVLAEVKQAQAQGLIDQGEVSRVMVAEKSMLPRDEVRKEARQIAKEKVTNKTNLDYDIGD